MLRKVVKYTTYDGDTRTQEFYFYLSKRDIQALDAKYQEDGGLSGRFNIIVNNRDSRRLLETVEDLILNSYGIKSEDGTSFNKSENVREAFRWSAAYETLFDELTDMSENTDKFSDFLKKILPNDVQAAIAKAESEGKVEMPEILAEAIKDTEANK